MCSIFNVCIVVIIHCHEYTHVFGDRSSPRIYLYKKDVTTHYDVLLPNPEPTTIGANDSSDAQVAVLPSTFDRAAKTRGTARILCSSSSARESMCVVTAVVHGV
jgi:hypothetical protein